MRFNLPEGISHARLYVIHGHVWMAEIDCIPKLTTTLYFMSDLELHVQSNGWHAVMKNNRICHISPEYITKMIGVATWL